MAIGARVESIDALRLAKIALVKFAEKASAALGEADADVQRTMMWLETEQLAYWQVQERNRATSVVQAREALRNKTMFKGPGGRTPPAIEEEKALKLATQRMEEAQAKIAAVKKWTPRLKNEIMTYHGAVQRLATTVQLDLPLAVGQLEGMIGTLEAYLALNDPAARGAAGGDAPVDESTPLPETTGGSEGGRKPPA